MNHSALPTDHSRVAQAACEVPPLVQRWCRSVFSTFVILAIAKTRHVLLYYVRNRLQYAFSRGKFSSEIEVTEFQNVVAAVQAGPQQDKLLKTLDKLKKDEGKYNEAVRLEAEAIAQKEGLGAPLDNVNEQIKKATGYVAATPKGILYTAKEEYDNMNATAKTNLDAQLLYDAQVRRLRQEPREHANKPFVVLSCAF